MTLKLLIDGILVDGATRLPVINPASGEVFATAPRADAAQVELAIAGARRAFPAWSRRSYADRGALINRLADALEQRQEEFGRLLTQEQGKPLAAARGEVTGSIATLRWCAAQELKPELLRENDAERILEQRYPLGVVAAITPWNYPLMILIQKVAPALITGNVVIAKPAPTTPLTTLLFGEMAADILPAGVLQTIVDNNELGALLSRHPGVDLVSFTGSTATGKKVLASATDTLKRFSLELGGNDAALILDDVDLETVAPRIYNSAMANSGQICVAVKRVYAPQAMVGPLCDIFARMAGEAVLGDGLNQGTTMGPVQNKVQYDKLVALLDQTREQGTLVAGGGVLQGPGYFIEPTVFRDLPDDAPLVTDEQFGPLLPVIGYEDLDAVIGQVNSTPFGLAGSVWSGDVYRAMGVASRIESGTVWINRHLGLPVDVPFGGAKQSGIGRQQGIEGLKEYTQGRIVNIALG